MQHILAIGPSALGMGFFECSFDRKIFTRIRQNNILIFGSGSASTFGVGVLGSVYYASTINFLLVGGIW